MSSGPFTPALPWRCLACAVVAVVLLMAQRAAAEPNLVLVLPTSLTRVEAPKEHARSNSELMKLEEHARRLDAILGEAVQDLGLTLDVSEPPRRERAPVSESELLARATERWVIAASIDAEKGGIRLRLVAVAPSSKLMLVRAEVVQDDELDVQAMRMLRELVASAQPGTVTEPAPAPGPRGVPVTRSRSPGVAVLALNSAILGGFTGYALQRASGSQDERLVYPLTALGAGIGLGASVIVADEWDVGVGDAWYVAAGTVWGGAAGLLFAEGYEIDPSDARPLYGVLGSVAGVTLATTSLSIADMSEGGATLAHSGGAFGVVLGSIGEAMVEGGTEDVPLRGAAWGAGAGVLLAGVLATQVETSPSRVLLVDLAAGLGGLTGAAAASPLVFGDRISESENRGWFGSIALGTALGAGVGVILTRSDSGSASGDGMFVASPFCGPVAAPLDAAPAPIGVGLSGRF